jgi:hypothetical protein
MKAKKQIAATLDEQRARLRELGLSYHALGKGCDLPNAQQAQLLAMWQVLTGYADTGEPAKVKVLYDFWAGVAAQSELMTSLLDACTASPEILRCVAEHAVRRLVSGVPARWDGWTEYIRDLCGSDVSKEVADQVVIAAIQGVTTSIETPDGRHYRGLWTLLAPRWGQPGKVSFTYGDAIHAWAAIEKGGAPA